MTNQRTFEVQVLGEEAELSLAQLSRACAADAEWLLSLINEGILVPQGRSEREWRFNSICIWRVRQVRRLQTDLGVNLAGAALALELLDELQQLRRRLHSLEQHQTRR